VQNHIIASQLYNPGPFTQNRAQRSNCILNHDNGTSYFKEEP